MVRDPPLAEDRVTCCPEAGQAIAVTLRTKRTGPQAISLGAMTKDRCVITAPVSKRR